MRPSVVLASVGAMCIAATAACATGMPMAGDDPSFSEAVAVRPIVVLPSDLEVEETSSGVYDLVQ